MVALILLLVAVAVAAVTWAVATGRLEVDGLAPATHSAPEHGLPDEPTAEDVDTVRFDTAPRGYRPAEVDERLEQLQTRLADREETIARLRAEED